MYSGFANCNGIPAFRTDKELQDYIKRTDAIRDRHRMLSMRASSLHITQRPIDMGISPEKLAESYEYGLYKFKGLYVFFDFDRKLNPVLYEVDRQILSTLQS